MVALLVHQRSYCSHTAIMCIRIKYMPRSEIVGKGLERIQEAIDLLAEGVSAKKLVVSI